MCTIIIKYLTISHCTNILFCLYYYMVKIVIIKYLVTYFFFLLERSESNGNGKGKGGLTEESEHTQIIV